MNPKVPKLFWQECMEQALDEYPECPSCKSEWLITVAKIRCSKCNMTIDNFRNGFSISNTILDKDRCFIFNWLSNGNNIKSLGTCEYQELEFVEWCPPETVVIRSINAEFRRSQNPIIKDGSSFKPNITLERLQSLIVFS